jgi:hypothetical protein
MTDAMAVIGISTLSQAVDMLREDLAIVNSSVLCERERVGHAARAARGVSGDEPSTRVAAALDGVFDRLDCLRQHQCDPLLVSLMDIV